jgi:ABC-2 type transport system permease protein
MVSGVIVLILAMVASLLTALTIAREWELGTMEQVFATPVSRLEIILGKLIPYTGLGFVQTLLVLTLGSYLFDIPIRGSVVTLFACSTLFLLAMLGTGLTASVLAKSQIVAVNFALMVAYMPVAMLSGFMFPIDNMPWWLQGISRAVPGQYYLTALRGVLLKGNGFALLVKDTVTLAIFAVGLLLLSVWRFRRRLA